MLTAVVYNVYCRPTSMMLAFLITSRVNYTDHILKCLDETRFLYVSIGHLMENFTYVSLIITKRIGEKNIWEEGKRKT